MKTELTVFKNLQAKMKILYNKLKLFTYEKTKGRKMAMPIVDYLTLAVLKNQCQIITIKSLWKTFEIENRCSYKTLVVNFKRFYNLALIIINFFLNNNRQNAHWVKHTDSTDIPVCLNKNAKHHKTMKGLAAWDHNGKGYFYGVKLHLTTDLNKKILAVKFASADKDEREIFIPLNKDLCGLFVADGGYVSDQLEKDFNIEGKRRVMIAPRKNMKKLTTYFELFVYRTRMLIEINFRNLKMFFGLITSLPRSVDGYLANYAYSLLAYVLA
jgi:hypothetical protein